MTSPMKKGGQGCRLTEQLGWSWRHGRRRGECIWTGPEGGEQEPVPFTLLQPYLGPRVHGRPALFSPAFWAAALGLRTAPSAQVSCSAPPTVSAMWVVFPSLLHTFPVWRIFHIVSPSRSKEQPQVPPLLLPLRCLDSASSTQPALIFPHLSG